ncbi:MAG: S1/P1 Nuclease, partial [Cyclobacteriaceae bacterium]
MTISIILVLLLEAGVPWGFFGHRMITRLAVFSLPKEMYPFFRKDIQLLSNLSVKPDQRRYAVPWEAQRHYLDMDAYSDTILYVWRGNKNYADSIDAEFRKEHGDLPRQVAVHTNLLTQAMIRGDDEKILILA